MPTTFKKDDCIYTYGDLLNFPEDERWELIAGIPYMQARPTDTHQEIMLEIGSQIRVYLRNKACRVFTEFSVWLEGKENDRNAQEYVVPDIVVSCNPQQITSGGILGAPDMIVEITSPSNAHVDRNLKLWQYRIAGIKEYWVVEPEDRYILVHTLNENGEYCVRTYNEGSIQVGIFENLEVEMNFIFPKE